ncbi:DUF2339 domain-containing protein [Bacillus sp. Marseille-P3661]|uniref:DUF2339 domain-containing protein n=1 Tax=Bacillus sp. Marseille-P3661 TaxID=1936234 RepID=UPI000C850AC2|nr:DUF2339 domain-containing protein [Bacillus sp. Marseille-P3661]
MNQDERIDLLEKKVETLEYEIRELRSALQTHNIAPIEVEKSNKHIHKRKVPTATQSEQKDKIDFEKQLTQTWLPRIFMIVLLLGVLWGFKVAIDFGIITPSVRILIGYIVGMLLSMMGYKQIKEKREKLGIVLFGGAFSILIFTTFAANVLYWLIPSIFAFLLNIIWLALGLNQSIKYNSQSLGIFIALGGYFVPFLVESNQPNSWLFTLYETILFVVLLYLSLRKQYIYLYFMSFFTLHLTFFAFSLVTTFTLDSYTIQTLAYGTITQFLFINLMFLRKTIYMKQQITILLTSFMLTMGWVTIVLDRLFAQWFSFVLTVLFLLLTVLFYNKNKEKMVIMSVVASLSLLISMSYILDDDWLLLIVLVEGTALLYLGWYFKSVFQKLTGSIIYLAAFLVSIETSVLSFFSTNSLIWITVLFTLGYILFGTIKNEPKLKGAKWGVALANVYIWLRYTTILVPLIFQGVSENVIQMTISFIWAILAVGVVIVGINKNNKNVRLVGLGVLFIALFKVVLIDLFMVSIVIRAILFIGIGAIGIVVSRLFYSR